MANKNAFARQGILLFISMYVNLIQKHFSIFGNAIFLSLIPMPLKIKCCVNVLTLAEI